MLQTLQFLSQPCNTDLFTYIQGLFLLYKTYSAATGRSFNLTAPLFNPIHAWSFIHLRFFIISILIPVCKLLLSANCPV